MNYVVKHPSLRNSTLLIRIPPATPAGRWVLTKVALDNNGFGKISKTVWHDRIDRAMKAGLVSQSLVIVGEEPFDGAVQHIGGPPIGDSEHVGVLDLPSGMRSINYGQYRAMVEDAMRTKAVLKTTDRPKGWV